MKRLTWALFIIAVVIVGIETFRPQPHFPGAVAGVGNEKAAGHTNTAQGNL